MNNVARKDLGDVGYYFGPEIKVVLNPPNLLTARAYEGHFFYFYYQIFTMKPFLNATQAFIEVPLKFPPSANRLGKCFLSVSEFALNIDDRSPLLIQGPI